MPQFNETLNPGLKYFPQLIIRGRVTQTNGDLRPVLNVLNFRFGSGAGVDNAGAFIGAFQTGFQSTFLAGMPSTYELHSYSVRWLDSYFNAETEITDGTMGGIATDRTTLFNAVYLSGYTAVRGRNFLGSKHFGPVAEEHTTGDELNTAGKAAWDATTGALNALNPMDDGVGTLWNQIILSTSLSVLGNEPVRTATYTTLIDWLRSDIVGTMRHRKEKRGVT